MVRLFTIRPGFAATPTAGSICGSITAKSAWEGISPNRTSSLIRPTRFKIGKHSPSRMTIRTDGVDAPTQNGNSRARRPDSTSPVSAAAIGCVAAQCVHIAGRCLFLNVFFNRFSISFLPRSGPSPDQTGVALYFRRPPTSDLEVVLKLPVSFRARAKKWRSTRENPPISNVSWLRAPRHSWVGLTNADRRFCSRAKTAGNFKTAS